MEAVLEPLIEKLLGSIEGIDGVVLSTDDAVCISQGWKRPQGTNSRETAIPAAIFPFIADQISKLPWGKIQTSTSEFKSATVFYVYMRPLVVTFVGSEKLDVDLIGSPEMLQRLEAALKHLRVAIPNV